MELSYTLLADGSSDRGLIPILTWMLKRHVPHCAVQSRWADLRRLRNPPATLEGRIETAVRLYPCSLLFIHRDAERESRQSRVSEIANSLANTSRRDLPHVLVVPVRMTETWLLFDEIAIRRAAGNPNGKMPLNLPRLKELETCADPKKHLQELIVEASGLSGRHRRRLNFAQCRQRISQVIQDFSPLLHLPAFREMDTEFTAVALGAGWVSNATL